MTRWCSCRQWVSSTEVRKVCQHILLLVPPAVMPFEPMLAGYTVSEAKHLMLIKFAVRSGH